MKISELIKTLQNVIEHHGDFEVWEGCDRCEGGLMDQCYFTSYPDQGPRLFLTHDCPG